MVKAILLFYSSISTPYLLFSTGTTINHVEPDGSNHQVLVTGLSGAFAVDYHYTYALISTTFTLPTKLLTSVTLTTHNLFLCSMNKMFWTSPINGKVYEAQLDNGNNPTEIVNVNKPRETLIH